MTVAETIRRFKRKMWKLFPQPLYNYLMLRDKNITVWQQGTAAIAMCPVCKELLVWVDINKPPVTLRVNDDLLDYFEKHVQPSIDAFHAATLTAMRRACAGTTPDRNLRPQDTQQMQTVYNDVIASAETLIQKHQNLRIHRGK